MVDSEPARSLLQNMPLRRKLRFTVIGATLLTLILVMSSYVAYEWLAINQQLHDDLVVRARIIATNSTAALSFNDAESAEEILDALSAAADVLSACTYKSAGAGAGAGAADATLFASHHRDGVTRPCPADLSNNREAAAGTMSVVQPISLDDEVLGSIFIEADLQQLWQRVNALARMSAIITVFILILAFALTRLVERAIAQPIMRLHTVVSEVSGSRNYALRAEPAGNDEIGALITGFNDMLSQVDRRDRDLLTAQTDLEDQIEKRDRANRELQSTLQKLETTQEQLVQSEKMASLGGLVAGVAHEINTPIGVALTAASTLQSRTRELKTAYDNASIGKRLLETYVAHAAEISEMIEKNLSRAAELIQSFKQVAVDQTSSERRTFDLREYIDETLLSLKPRLKNVPYTLTVDCAGGITLNSYPGAISQVLTNLIVNSLTHAFEGRDTGAMHIAVTSEADKISLDYTDDGIGMDANSKPRIFDPFFTTKRGQGGSGLGMHIVFNLVTSTLGGTINLVPTDTGMHFHITIPLQAPA